MTAKPLDAWVQCGACGRRHRWREELAGRNVACVCGGDVKYPLERPAAAKAQAPLRDESKGEFGVDLDAVFDSLGAAESDHLAHDAGALLRRRHRGLFRLSLEGELVVYGVFALVGVACTILAILVGKYFVPYIVAAVLVGPASWWLFWKRWRLWTKDRTLWQALSQVISGEEEGQDDAGVAASPHAGSPS